MKNDLKAIEALVTEAAIAPEPLPRDAGWAERARFAVAGSARLSPVEQLNIYREQFWGRHIGSLEEDFVMAKHLLGDGGYYDLCKAYLEAHPPTTYDLRALGRDLPAFVATRAPYMDDALLVESLRLDWAYMEAFDAPPTPPFDPSVLASIPEEAWPAATITLHPSLRLLSLAYPVAPMRAAMRRGESPPRPEPQANHVGVYRNGEWLRWIALEPAAHALLLALAQGEALGAACETAARAHASGDVEAIGRELGAWFQTWTSEGLIARVVA